MSAAYQTSSSQVNVSNPREYGILVFLGTVMSAFVGKIVGKYAGGIYFCIKFQLLQYFT